ncbi:HAD family hydrolase [Allocoprobacillus halotolerans]|uniref:HAD family hydrolase n=1 Tax=Allocoprobacillus halotolerans TaxID=2944914 RepID=A0ABY5I406_9FIRM|nr:HAD family hydrolase [Allocoprobacillus halotolerans]UTY40076.1 HAD family hydrolase [Allocoprobacillus halotolerans]
MTTLYVSDLDGTLLNSQQTLSNYTMETINQLVDEGMLFSYATARSYQTAKKVTQGFKAHIPLIVYNGAVIRDNQTGEILLSHCFKKDIHQLLDHFLKKQIYPMVYAFINGEEKFSFIPEKCTPAMLEFIDTRKGDPRIRVIHDIQDFYIGDIFYITFIDESEKLEPFYLQYHNQYQCLFQKDIYTNQQWLEIMPQHTSKAHAIEQLKALYHYDKLVVFGDGENDIEMFQLADEAYAVDNAHEKLKAIATKIIPSNDNDGVAHFLKQTYKKP